MGNGFDVPVVIKLYLHYLVESSNGRTADSGSAYPGSNPGSTAADISIGYMALLVV